MCVVLPLTPRLKLVPLLRKVTLPQFNDTILAAGDHGHRIRGHLPHHRSGHPVFVGVLDDPMTLEGGRGGAGRVTGGRWAGQQQRLASTADQQPVAVRGQGAGAVPVGGRGEADRLHGAEWWCPLVEVPSSGGAEKRESRGVRS